MNTIEQFIQDEIDSLATEEASLRQKGNLGALVAKSKREGLSTQLGILKRVIASNSFDSITYFPKTAEISINIKEPA